MLSILSYLLIAGILVFLVLMFLGPSSGSEAATKGIGTTMTFLAIAAIVFLLVFNLQANNSLKYIGLVLGLLCFAALIVILLALSGSSLVFQDTRTKYMPTYYDPVLRDLFEAFEKGKTSRWVSLLESHPDHIHNEQLLGDILYDVIYDEPPYTRKLACLKYMLEAGAKLDTIHYFNFCQIAYTGKVDMTELLLQHGADPNCMVGDGPQLLVFHVIDGNEDASALLDVLVKYGANINATYYNEQFQDTITPLSYAVKIGSGANCKALLKYGADLNFKSKDGLTIKEMIIQKAAEAKAQNAYLHPALVELAQQFQGH